MFFESSLARTEWAGLTLPVGEFLDSLRSFAARHGLGVAWARVEDHTPEPPGLDSVTAFLGQDGEVAQGQVAVDALVDATELVGTLERQDPLSHRYRRQQPRGRQGLKVGAQSRGE